MTKVAIVSDLQVDTYDRLSTLLPDGRSTRLRDVIAAFEWAVSEAVDQGCELLVILGDIFDNRTSISLPVLDATCRAFHAASERLPTIIVAGNHDSYLRSPSINSLQAFRGFATIVDDGSVMTDGGLLFVPWHDDVAQVSAWIDAAPKSAKYLFTHALLKGACPGPKGMDPAALRPAAFRRVILGDVHEPVHIKPNIHYVGALLPLHFGDAMGTRGFQILDTVANKLTHIPNVVSPRFHIVRDGLVRDSDVRKGDFVRVETDDAEVAVKAVARARFLGAWVEANAPTPETIIVPRADIRTSHSDDQLLTTYMAHQRLDDPELLAMGADILAEARAAD